MTGYTETIKVIQNKRLESEGFRKKVRYVLNKLGVESNVKNFLIWDKILDWNELAHSFKIGPRGKEVCSFCGLESNVMITVQITGKKCCSKCFCH